MKMNIGKLGMLLAVFLLVGSVFVGSVSAGSVNTNDTNNLSGIGEKEKIIIFEVTDSEKVNTSNVENAENDRKNVEKEINKQIEKSLKAKFSGKENSLQSTESSDFTILAGTGTVYLGTDKTFYDASDGDKGTFSTGVCTSLYGSEYYLSSEKSEAATLLGPGGYCSKGAWAWVGKSFYVSGSGSQTANIIQAGHIKGLTTAFGGGSSNVKINFVVKDLTTGAEYSTTIYSKSEGGVGWTEVNKNYNKGIAVNLQAGHNYVAYLLVETSGAIYGVGEAGSDFGRQDGDYAGEGAWYYSIKIDF